MPRRPRFGEPGILTAMNDVEVAIAAAEAGAAVVRELYGTAVGRHDKSPTDFATDADLAAEKAIGEVLRNARPDDALVGEEFGATGQSDRTWLVDPLCGTLNFAAQTPLFSVNIALRSQGRTLVAAVADPLAGEIFWTAGTTAALRRSGTDTQLVPSATSRLVDIDADAPRDADLLPADLIDSEFRDVFAPRVSSTTLTLAWTAAGRRAAYVSNGTLHDSVHFTPGIALCEAAGCIVTDLRGAPLHTGPGLVAAADPKTHQQLLNFIAPRLN
jgi:myo-inositol-1(or 4)-monophosphatase